MRRGHRPGGGIGSASATEGSVVVGALFAVNAVGEILAEDGAVLAGVRAGATGDEEELEPTAPWPGPPRDPPSADWPGPPRENGPV